MAVDFAVDTVTGTPDRTVRRRGGRSNRCFVGQRRTGRRASAMTVDCHYHPTRARAAAAPALVPHQARATLRARPRPPARTPRRDIPASSGPGSGSDRRNLGARETAGYRTGRIHLGPTHSSFHIADTA